MHTALTARKNGTGYLFFAMLMAVLPGGAGAVEVIPSFDAHIVVRNDAVIEVTETIVYDFGEDAEDRHGIYRRIPYSYQAGTETYTADISGVVVTDEAGNALPFTEDMGRGTAEMTLKIGDPEKTVEGMHTYVVSYIVSGPFLWFETSDELYWVLSGGWPNAIARASVIVDLPPGAKVLDAACYRGAEQATTACEQSEKLVSDERAGYRAEARDLAPREQMAFAVSFPQGTIAEVSEQHTEQAQPAPWYAWLILPLIVAAVGTAWWYRKV